MSTRTREYRHIWIITGPAGCGKSTVASHIADELSLPFIEGDEFHPPANIAKMSSGTPLDDVDRWDWLIILRQRAVDEITRGSSGVVVTCSALKRKYRDVIRVASYYDRTLLVHFVYLRASEQLLLGRVKARQGHYMKDDMVHSQYRSLEEPTANEIDCAIVDAEGPLKEVEGSALNAVKQELEKLEIPLAD